MSLSFGLDLLVTALTASSLQTMWSMRNQRLMEKEACGTIQKMRGKKMMIQKMKEKMKKNEKMQEKRLCR